MGCFIVIHFMKENKFVTISSIFQFSHLVSSYRLSVRYLEHNILSRVYMKDILVAKSDVFCEVLYWPFFVFLSLSFDHCIVCPSNYGLRLHLRFLQTSHITKLWVWFWIRIIYFSNRSRLLRSETVRAAFVGIKGSLSLL